MNVLEVHISLLERMRESRRIRTVQWKPREGQPLMERRGRRGKDSVLALNRRIMALRRAGYSLRDICDEVKCSMSTVNRHTQGRVTAVAKATNPRRQRWNE